MSLAQKPIQSSSMWIKSYSE